MFLSRAFTLVEILVVVIILAILGAIVVPAFSTAAMVARASMMADDLRVLRTQLQVFTAQHADSPPGYPNGNTSAAPDEATLILHLTQATTPGCLTANVGTPGFDLGPYFSAIPPNPLNGKATVQIIGNNGAFPVAGDNSHGWVYQPVTLQIKGDSPGADENGRSYFDY
jgi:prepilin-type N-terminal cleavage/methylation domain-containing protein